MTPLAPLAGPVLTDGPFDLITGIPVHPLVVHAVVVLLPLSALALVAIVLVPKWRGAFGWVTMAGLAIGTASAFVAKQSGEQLAARVGLPQEHSDLGNRLPLAAAALFVVAAVWFVLQRRAARSAAEQGASQQGTVLVRVLGIVAIVLALATTALTVATGHTGAVSVWEGRVQPASAPATPAPSDSAAASTAPTADGGLTLADVQEHATPADCWAVVNGIVYDLTAWVDQHPGGAAVIESMCGTDATAAFTAQHGGQAKPESTLAGFEVGVLGATPAAAGPALTITPAAFVLPRAERRYTMAEVRKHRTPTDCWAVVNRGVYNLTAWINQHPGGASRIIALCGRNGSAAFTAQHGSASNVAAILKSFRIGRLA